MSPIKRASTKKTKFTLYLWIQLLLLLFMQITAFAGGWPVPEGAIQSEGAILIDADSDAVLYAKNEHEPYYPASITKVLTAIIVLENAESLEDKVSFSYAATNTNLEANSTVIGAVPGDRLSVRDCLYSLLLHSANDCANALAEYIAGSNEEFAKLMNEKAASLGCTDSSFKNPSGLNDPGHYTSCADMAKIMQYAIQNPAFRQIDSAQVYTHAPISKYPAPDAPENTVYAHHRMMRKSYSSYYEGVFAGKTGYTMLAGNTLVTACEKDGMTLICVILNGHNSQYSDTRKLFDFGYQNFRSYSAEEYDESYRSLESNLKISGIPIVRSLEFSIDPGNHVTLPKTEAFSAASSVLSYALSEQEKTDGSVAKVEYQYEGRDVGSAYIRLLDRSDEYAAELQDAAVMEAKVQETVPESISVSNQEEKATVAGQLPQESSAGRAPILFDKEQGRIIVQKPILRVLSILGIMAAGALLVLLILYLFQRREEFLRKRRRARILRHTRDLTREQKARRDLMLGKKSSRRKSGFRR